MAKAVSQMRLMVTDMCAEAPDILAEPDKDNPRRMVVEQGDESVWLDRHGAELLANFLLSWEPPSDSD